MERVGRYRKSVLLLATGVAAFVPTGAAHAGTGVAVGDGDLNNGVHMRVVTGSGTSGLSRAWITEQALEREITLDCVDITPVVGPYPFPPYGLYSVFSGSGVAADGSRVYITVADFGVTNRGQRDLVQVATTPGTRPCGARTDALHAVMGGDFVVTL